MAIHPPVLKEAKATPKSPSDKVYKLPRKRISKRALVTCSTENPASRAVILANGGVYEDNRNGTEHYWIDVD